MAVTTPKLAMGVYIEQWFACFIVRPSDDIRDMLLNITVGRGVMCIVRIPIAELINVDVYRLHTHLHVCVY